MHLFFPGSRRFVRYGLSAVAVVVFVLSVTWWVAPYCVDDPLPAIARRTPVRMYFDRTGTMLYCERTYQYEWRFDVKLSDIASDVRHLMLITEDARFFEHGGVDYYAVARACFQNLLSGRIVSGASTISMQVAAMDYAPRRRSFLKKFIQAAKARKMESLHSKTEILETYFNNIPFGGKIFGIEAAARFYFGMTASKLTLVEASILCGIPQRPNRYRPDRYPASARVRQRRVLNQLVHAGHMTPTVADELFADKRLRYRDFALPASFERYAASRELRNALPVPRSDEFMIRSSMNRAYNDVVRNMLSRQCDHFQDVRDAAAVVLNARTGEVLAYVGTLDFDRASDGQVDAVRATRSAGSTLKPFIYAKAIDSGRLVAETVLLDAPVRYATYAPGNFDGRFHGRVTATEALSYSLNTPVVRVLAALGGARIAEHAVMLGVARATRAEDAGLALALGVAGCSLLDLTRAYSVLARGGTLPELTFRATDKPVGGERIYADGTCAMTSMMLRRLPLIGTTLDVAWKTGTSSNLCDAWCVAYTPDYVIGVWFGNKNGDRAASLVGAKIAAPVASEIMGYLYQHRALPVWPSVDTFFTRTKLCDVSGLAAGDACAGQHEGDSVTGIPLRRCDQCGARHATTLTILSPVSQPYRIAMGDTLTLNLSANEKDVVWFVDGVYRGAVSTHAFTPGKHVVVAVAGDKSTRLTFSVLPMQ